MADASGSCTSFLGALFDLEETLRFESSMQASTRLRVTLSP